MARRDYYTATDDEQGTRRPYRYDSEIAARAGAARKAKKTGRPIVIRLHLNGYSYVLDTIGPCRKEDQP